MQINQNTPYFFRHYPINNVQEAMQVGKHLACFVSHDEKNSISIVDMQGRTVRVLPTKCCADCHGSVKGMEKLDQYLLVVHCCTRLRLWNLDPTSSLPPEMFKLETVKAIKKIDTQRLVIITGQHAFIYNSKTRLMKSPTSWYWMNHIDKVLAITASNSEAFVIIETMNKIRLGFLSLTQGKSNLTYLRNWDDNSRPFYFDSSKEIKCKIVGEQVAIEAVKRFCTQPTIVIWKRKDWSSFHAILICEVPNDEWQRNLQEKPIFAYQLRDYKRQITTLLSGPNETLAVVEHGYTHFWDLRSCRPLGYIDRGGEHGVELPNNQFALIDRIGVIRIVDFQTQGVVQILDHHDKIPVKWQCVKGVTERFRHLCLGWQYDKRGCKHKDSCWNGKYNTEGWTKFFQKLPQDFKESDLLTPSKLLVQSNGKLLRPTCYGLQIWCPPSAKPQSVAIQRIQPLDLRRLPINDPSFDLNNYRLELTQLVMQQQLQNQRLLLGEQLKYHLSPQVSDYYLTLCMQLQSIILVLQLSFSGWIKNQIPVTHDTAEHRLHGMEDLPHEAHEFIEAINEIAEAAHGERVMHALHQMNMPIPFVSTILFLLTRGISFSQNRERRKRLAVLRKLISLLSDPVELMDMIAINATRRQIPFLESLPLHQPKRRFQGLRDYWARFTAHEHFSPAQKLALSDASTIIMRYIADQPELTRYNLAERLEAFIPER